jgi:hypothetical protein
MRRILKFPVAAYRGSDIVTADEPTFLSAGAQGDTVVVWVEAEVGSGKHTPVIGILTGQPAPEPDDDATFVGTAQMHNGIVVHVYHGPTV